MTIIGVMSMRISPDEYHRMHAYDTAQLNFIPFEFQSSLKLLSRYRKYENNWI